MMRVDNVCAVLVSYHPDLRVLAEVLDALRPQVGQLLIVDNASPGDGLRACCDERPEVTLLALPENLGLAQALNLGIAQARCRAGIERVLLLDQDSVPAAGMVAALVAALDRLSASAKIAAVGPSFRDHREARPAPFVRVRFPCNRKLICTGGADTIACDFLITSGSLIPLTVLDEVGDMDAALFIDNVDLDWCFRATAAGYSLHGVCAASLAHRLGDARRRLPGLPRGIVVHAPRRLFYMMRNRILLYRRRHTPRRWIAQDLPRLVVKLLLFALVVPPRGRNLRAMLTGIRAGMGGRYDAPPAGD